MSKRKDRWSAIFLPGMAKAEARAAMAMREHIFRHEDYFRRSVTSYASISAEEGLYHLEESKSLYPKVAAAFEESAKYWVSAPMAKVGMDAALDVPEIYPLRDAPSPCGLMAFEKPLPPLPSALHHMLGDEQPHLPDAAPVSALMWRPNGNMLSASTYTWSGHGNRIPTSFHRPESTIGPFVEVFTQDVPLRTSLNLEDLEAPVQVKALFAFLSAAWVLMETPTVAEKRVIDPKTGGAPRPGAVPSVPLVTTIDLRPLRHEVKTAETDESGRVYRHRWIVRGHWRNQAHGPGLTKRRMTWVPSYIKGPEGAPLLATEKVMVWRR